jgi:alkylresorcinol/alkylpyrone synthase
MGHIAGVASVLPPHVYPQEEITRAIRAVVFGDDADPGPVALLERLHRATGVRRRALALPLEEYAGLKGFGSANDAYLRVAVELGERALREALREARLEPGDVDTLLTVSTTGVAAPSLDARLVPRVGLRRDVTRVPVFGLGCLAGAAGIARVVDLLRGNPDGVAVLLAVELCSLTVQRDDASAANLVASGLFSDAAAAVVVVGSRRAERLGLPGPAVVGSRSHVYPDTERVMAWDVADSGFRIVLAPTVADVVRTHLGADVDAFLASHGLARADIGSWVAHPGGPKVMTALEETLALPPDALAVTRDSLAEMGNASSVSVLDVLARTIATRRPAPGTPGVLMALGPGFSAELVLLRW